MTTTFPGISILVSTYRQPEVLLLTLRDLMAQDYAFSDWELVLLDDGGKDQSAQFALAMLSPDIAVTIVRRPSGGMYSHAVLFNELLRVSNPASQVFIHTEDTRLRSDFIRQHLKWHLGESKVLVTGPMCEGPAETFKPEACSRWKLMKGTENPSRAYNCCFQGVFAKSMSYTRTVFESLTELPYAGPFDERMEGWGYHETEFAFRASRRGVKCIYDVDCAVYHPAHNSRDEAVYRGIDRDNIVQAGTAKNIEYFCQKHQLKELPPWENGIPTEVPAKSL